MNGFEAGDDARIEGTLRRTRRVAGALALGPLVLAGVAGFLPLEPQARLAFLAAPVALVGLVSPVIGHRLFLGRGQRLPPDREARCASYTQATILALAVTEGIALLGIVTHVLTGRLFPLVGLLSHTLLAGALWPSREKLEGWLGHSGPADAH